MELVTSALDLQVYRHHEGPTKMMVLVGSYCKGLYRNYREPTKIMVFGVFCFGLEDRTCRNGRVNEGNLQAYRKLSISF